MKLDPAFTRVLDDAVKRHGLEAHHRELALHARPMFLLRVRPARPDEGVPVGASKFGGAPDLPDDFAWPRIEEGTLEFIGQINLADLPDIDHPLPRSGLLSVFAETEDDIHAVRVFDTDSVRSRSQPPEEDTIDPGAWDVDPVTPLLVTEFVPSVSLPGLIELTDLIDALDEDELYDTLNDLNAELTTLEGDDVTCRLMGYASDSYGDTDDDTFQLMCAESIYIERECYMNFWDAGSLHVVVSSFEVVDGHFPDSEVYVVSM